MPELPRSGKSQILRMASQMYGNLRQRHQDFLTEILQRLMESNADAYQEFGRGLWMFRDNPEQDGSQGAYMTDLTILPDDHVGRRVRGMVDTYTPPSQAVVLLVESGDSAHAYTIGARIEGQ